MRNGFSPERDACKPSQSCKKSAALKASHRSVHIFSIPYSQPTRDMTNTSCAPALSRVPCCVNVSN